ncbi:hypothetical protein [Microbacterium aquilitoris]|uniref:hypothetical protein n=1 Tax=Microbacterium aquilitoris TaxID=3067307 RepID=UPI002890334B|nr:hypothetical protein [Microbacterium sp. KSW2-22]MDT3343886.1 hypothetical protein [Microbacterium sp. KSW2-22]
MSEITCPMFDWCEFTSAEHITEDLHGFEFVVVAEESSVDVRVFHGTREGEDDWSINMDIGDWVIETATTASFGDELEREFWNLRSIVDQIEARVREFQRRHVGMAVRRNADVDENLRRLADA